MTWKGSIQALKEFIEDVLNLSGGKWSSPGGDVKLYRDENQDISIRWHSKTHTITISGDENGNIEEQLTLLATVSLKPANSDVIEDSKTPDKHGHNETGKEKRLY